MCIFKDEAFWWLSTGFQGFLRVFDHKNVTFLRLYGFKLTLCWPESLHVINIDRIDCGNFSAQSCTWQTDSRFQVDLIYHKWYLYSVLNLSVGWHNLSQNCSSVTAIGNIPTLSYIGYRQPPDRSASTICNIFINVCGYFLAYWSFV